MRRTFLAFAAVFLLLASSLATVAAQAGTPGAESPAGANGKGVIPVGTAVTLVDNNDQPAAKLTVTKFEDPFTGYDQSSPPQRGFHFVAATVSLFNVGSQPVTGNGYFQAVDADGFTYQQTYVYLTSSNQPEAFNGLTANPGEVQTGIVYFQVLNNVKIERIVYQPDFQRWLTVLDLRASVVKPGTPVEVVDANGQPSLEVTITKFEEPIANVSSSNQAQRGFEFSGAEVTIVNKGSAAIMADPSNFIAIDADGFAYTFYGVQLNVTPAAGEADFQSGVNLDPGKSITGLLSYQVLKGSKINQIIFMPNTGSSTQFIEVANQGIEGVKSAATPGPQPSPSAEGNASGNASAEGNASGNASAEGNASGNASDQGNASGNASDQGNASSVPTPDVSGVDCNAVLKWANDVLFANLTALTGIATDLAQWETAQNPVTTIDPAKARADAKTASDAANAIKKSKAPKEIQPIADAFAGIMQAYADGFNSLAAHVEAKDAAGIKADFDALNKASDSFNNPQLNALGDALSSACPDLENLGE